MFSLNMRRYFWILTALASAVFLFPLGCNTGTDGNKFQINYVDHDSLTSFDSVVVLLEQEGQALPDTLFKGKLLNADDLKHLPLPAELHGEIKITVKGFKNGELTLSREKVLDSDNNQVVTTNLVKSPLGKVRFDSNSVRLGIGDSINLPKVTIEPLEWANRSILYSFQESKGVAVIVKNMVVGLLAGTTHLIARVDGDSTVADTVAVIVESREALAGFQISPDTLKAFLGGPNPAFSIRVLPAGVSTRVDWLLKDSALAKVDDTGAVSALKEGLTQIIAVSQVNTGFRDTVWLLVLRDIPKLNVGQSLTVNPGTEVTFDPQVEQLFGGITKFLWDLDGDLVWDDSASNVKILKRTYASLGKFTARFLVRDGEGNEGEAQRIIQVTQGPLVIIRSPVNGFVTREKTINVNWEVNGVLQTEQAQETLANEGANTLTRSATSDSGTTIVSIMVYLDTQAPVAPIVSGKSPVNTKTPTFTWHGVSGGAGVFRAQIDVEPGDGLAEFRDTTLTWPVDLSEGPHTLFVQERDSIGNWSQSGSRAIIIDVTPAVAPLVQLVGPAITSKTSVTFNWRAGNEGLPQFRYRLEQDQFNLGSTAIGDTSLTLTLAEGHHTLFVQQRDSAGNFSKSGSADVDIDLTAPDQPVVKSLTGPYSNTGKPTWTWSNGLAGGGLFRYRLDTLALTALAFTGDTAYTPATKLSEGAHTIYVQGRDGVGNVSPVESSTVIVDTQKPGQPVCLDPAANAWVNTQNPTWKWNTVAGGDGRFLVVIPGQYGSDASAPITALTFTSPVKLPEGLQTLWLRAFDAAGNLSDTAKCQVRIDTTPPAAPLATAPAKFTNSLKPTRNFTANNATGLGFRVQMDKTDMTGATNLPFAANASYTPTANLTEGKHVMYVQVLDSAGNVSTLLSDAFTVDVTPPAAPVLTALQPSPSMLCAGQASAVAKYAPPTGIVNGIYAWNDSTLSVPTALGTTTVNISLGASVCFTGNSNTLYARVTDSAGNLSSLARVGPIAAFKAESEFFQPISSQQDSVFEFKAIGTKQYVAWFGLNSFGGSYPQVAFRSAWNQAWTELETPFTVNGYKLAMAADPAGNQIALSNYGYPSPETYLWSATNGWNLITLPLFDIYKESLGFIQMDFDASGILYIAFYKGGPHYPDFGQIQVTGVCKVDAAYNCNLLGTGTLTNSIITSLAFTAKPSPLLVVVNDINHPEVFGMKGTTTPTMASITTGMESRSVTSITLGSTASSAHLMYFTTGAVPNYQVVNYSSTGGGTWSPQTTKTLPAALGVGLGAFAVDANGRPYLALNGAAWGLDGGYWKSLKTSSFSLDPASDNILMAVGGDGIPYLLAYAYTWSSFYRTAFDLPSTSVAQP